MSREPSNPPKTPLSPGAMIDLYFLEARSRLLDIAAFLDRVDRAAERVGVDASEDFRVRALHEALERVASLRGGRAEAAQLIFSDPTEEPIESAAGMKGATGAYPGASAAKRG